MNKPQTYYPGFEYPAEDLSAFIVTMDTFIISLKNGRIIRFATADTTAFEQWLVQHRVRDIRTENNNLPKIHS